VEGRRAYASSVQRVEFHILAQQMMRRSCVRFVTHNSYHLNRYK
jgi:nicotinamide riboside kinase